VSSAQTHGMGTRKKVVGALLVFVLFPIALAVLAAVAVAVGLKALAMYLGGLLAPWLLFAYVLPMLTGVMAPSEVLAGIKARHGRRNLHEGVPLPNLNDMWGESLVKNSRETE
jgi:hypothetical protein